LFAHGRWFSPGTPASSTTKTGRHDIAEILLKVALKHQKSNQSIPIMYLVQICMIITRSHGLVQTLQSNMEGFSKNKFSFINNVYCVLCGVFLCVVFYLSSCVPQVASVSGLSILNCPFGFLQHLFYYLTLTQETIQSILIHRHKYLCKDPRESRHMKTI
jgi:hypothetical protein